MGRFQSTKIYDGFSTTFRQWKANGTNCRFLHGYDISFKITFDGDLDEKGWIYDFGGLKRSIHKIDGKTPSEWFSYMFDHTTVIAADDPEYDWFVDAENKGIIQLRFLYAVGIERFAEYVYTKINEFVIKETNGRVIVSSVECFEHQKNSAIYKI